MGSPTRAGRLFSLMRTQNKTSLWPPALRKPSDEVFRPELKSGVSIVRELHVYGSVVPVSARDPTKFQHQGFGTLLMEEAERIARDEHGANKISVISGVGTRNYYRKLGYELDGPYMSKNLLPIC